MISRRKLNNIYPIRKSADFLKMYKGMFRGILMLCLLVLTAKYTAAQNFLPTHNYIKQKVVEGYFLQKPNTVIPADDYCISVAEARSYLYVVEAGLPVDGRMPWYADLVPYSSLPTCAQGGWSVCPMQDPSYSACGSYIYNEGYNANLSNAVSQKISAANNFWIGNAANCGTPGTSTLRTTDEALMDASMEASSIDNSSLSVASVAATAAVRGNLTGPLNRTGIWPCTAVNTQWLSINRVLTVAADTLYYVGIAGNNAFRIVVDNVLKVEVGVTQADSAYKKFHIIPVRLTAGTHFLGFEGYNFQSTASLGVEIYLNTKAQIMAAISYAGLNVLFSTKDFTGTICPSGFETCRDGLGTPGRRMINGVCQTVSPVCISSVRIGTTSSWTNTYKYTWSDGSFMTNKVIEGAACH